MDNTTPSDNAARPYEPGEPPPLAPGEVDTWRNWILEASARMVAERRKTMRRQDHHEVVCHGVTVLRDEIVALQNDAARLRADLAAVTADRDSYKTLLTVTTPPVAELNHRMAVAAHEWSLVRRDGSPLPGLWRTGEGGDL